MRQVIHQHWVDTEVAKRQETDALGALQCGFESLPEHHSWGISSFGRAVALQAIGDRFDPGILQITQLPD